MLNVKSITQRLAKLDDLLLGAWPVPDVAEAPDRFGCFCLSKQ